MTMRDDSDDEYPMDLDDSFEAQMQAHIENGDFDLDLEPGSDSSDSDEDSEENEPEEPDFFGPEGDTSESSDDNWQKYIHSSSSNT